jgi:hypothetical protein
MPSKSSTPTGRKHLVDNVYEAIKAYVEGGDGRVYEIKTIEIVPRIGLEFDVSVRCIGKRPRWDDAA